MLFLATNHCADVLDINLFNCGDLQSVIALPFELQARGPEPLRDGSSMLSDKSVSIKGSQMVDHEVRAEWFSFRTGDIRWPLEVEHVEDA